MRQKVIKSGGRGAGTELLLTVGAPRNKGSPTGQIAKITLGLVVINITLEARTSSLGGQRKKIQERSPGVISVQLKFPNRLGWSLDFLYLHHTICQPFTHS